jgi:Fe2+ or Zn2+ uptake regulation protein
MFTKTTNLKKVILELLYETKSEYTTKEIAYTLSENYKGVQNELRVLEKMGLVSKTKVDKEFRWKIAPRKSSKVKEFISQ